MSLKAGLIKRAIKLIPWGMVSWVANRKMKGIATLMGVNFDIAARKAYVCTQLNGEAEPIEVFVEGFAVIRDGDSYKFFPGQLRSNKPWINNAFARIAGKAWTIPVSPRFAPQANLIAELFEARNPES